jgi:hypothetical protein
MSSNFLSFFYVFFNILYFLSYFIVDKLLFLCYTLIERGDNNVIYISRQYTTYCRNQKIIA